MNPTLQTILTILIAVGLFLLVIIIHELGHFSFAKLFGVKVNEFAVGMGPKLFGRKKGDTTYSLRLIPIGGYCAMEGEDEDSSDERAFNRQKVWKRIIIVVAGAVFNIILGFIFMAIIQGQANAYDSNKISGFYSTPVSASDYAAVMASDSDAIASSGDAAALSSDMIFYCYIVSFDKTAEPGTDEAQHIEHYEMVKKAGDATVTDLEPMTLEQLVEDGYIDENGQAVVQPADVVKGENCYILRQATSSYTGLRSGDVIYSVNGSRALCFNDAYFEMALDEDHKVDMVVIRKGEKIELTGVTFDEGPQGYAVLDFVPERIEKSFGVVLQQTFLESQYMVRSVYKSLFMLLTGRVGMREMSGPVGIASAIGEAASAGFVKSFGAGVMNILYVMALIAFNLGIVNLLPLPALDGGRLIFLIVEGIRRKPVPPKYEGIVHTVGFILLLLLMVVITFNDISKLVTSCMG